MKKCYFVSALIFIILLSSCGARRDVSISFLDDGGIASWITTENSCVVVDCGSVSDAEYIIESVSSAGLKKIDMLVLSKNDERHTSGAEYIIKHFPVSYICDVSNSLSEYGLEYNDILPAAIVGDEQHTIDGVKYSIYIGKSQCCGDGAAFVMADISGVSVALASDISREHLYELVSVGYDLCADVIRMPEQNDANSVFMCARTGEMGGQYYESGYSIPDMHDGKLYGDLSSTLSFSFDGNTIVATYDKDRY